LHTASVEAGALQTKTMEDGQIKDALIKGKGEEEGVTRVETCAKKLASFETNHAERGAFQLHKAEITIPEYALDERLTAEIRIFQIEVVECAAVVRC